MVASPCINICKIDKTTGLCMGCLRYISEIANWSSLDDDEKLWVMEDIAYVRSHVYKFNIEDLN